MTSTGASRSSRSSARRRAIRLRLPSWPRCLVAAENPLIVTSRSARTPAGLKLLVELAETLQAGVIDQQRRMNFPTRHPLNQTQRTRAAVTDADLILGLEVYDFFGVVHTLGGQVRGGSQVHHQAGYEAGEHQLQRPASTRATIRTSSVTRTSICPIPADAEATLPELIEAVKRLLTADRKRAIEARGAKLEGRELSGAGSNSHGGILRLGREPCQHRAPVGRTVGPDQE